MDILEQLEEKIIDALTTIEQINQENSELKSQLEQAHAQAEETQQEMFGLTEALRESEQLQEILEGEIEDHLKKQGELSSELEQIREDNLRISHQKHEWEVKITNLLSQLTDIDTPSIPPVAEEVSSDTEEYVAEESFEEQSIEAESTSENIENDSNVEIEQELEESEVEAADTNAADSLFADEDLPQVADIKTAKRKKDKKQNVEAQDEPESEEAQIQAEIF